MSKHYDVVKDVAYLLRLGFREQKQQQVERRILSVIFDAHPTKQALQLASVLASIEAHGSSSPFRNNALVDAIAARIVEKERFVLLLELPKMRWNVRAESTVENTHHFRGYTRLLNACCVRIGASLTHSMQWALFLLEMMARWSQTLIEREDHHFLDHGQFAAMIIRGTAALPPHALAPQKQWLHRLIEEASNNPEVSTVLSAMINVLVAGQKDRMLGFDTMPSDDPAALELLRRAPYWWFQGELVRQPVLRLSFHHMATFERLQKNIAPEHERREAQLREAITWCARNRMTLKRAMHQKRAAILEHPRRGFRPRGLDHVDINVVALQAIGIRSIAFYPEGHMFPDVVVHILTRKETPHILIFKRLFSQCQLPFEKDLVSNSAQSHYRLLHALLAYVVVDIFWRIVVGERGLRSKKNEGNSKEARAVLGVAEAVDVPFHRRNLPAGYHASIEAQAEAAKVGWTLREGETFVRQYDYQLIPGTYREGGIHYNLPTEPVAIYGDSDLMTLTDSP